MLDDFFILALETFKDRIRRKTPKDKLKQNYLWLVKEMEISNKAGELNKTTQENILAQLKEFDGLIY